MKKCVQKILAGVIALAMIFGNFAGTGVTVARAASDTMDVCVKDENGETVNNLLLIFSSNMFGDIDFDELTDKEGKVETNQNDLWNILDAFEAEGVEEGIFFIKPAEGEGYSCDHPIEVHFVMDGDSYYGSMPQIDKVNGSEYNGAEISLNVRSAGSDAPVKSEITSVSSSVEEIGRNGGNTTITVTGTALPADMYYQVWYGLQNGGSLDAGKFQAVAASGTNTERKFSIKLPSASEFPKAIGWKINISLVNGERGKDTEIINIAKDAATGEISALGVAIKEIATLKEADYTVKSWKAYNAAIEAAKPLHEDINASNANCRAAFQEIEKTKAALILVKDLATAATKASLDSMLKEASGLKEADYTAASWKVYSAAIDAGKALAAEEDATEVQCQAVIKQIKDAKAALVKKATKVSKITIKGASKSIAVGKSIQLTAGVSPAKATNKAVKWTVSNKKYATVTSKGKVTVKKAGAGKTVTVTATAKDGSGKKATYKIKIMKDTVKSIKLKAAKTVKAGKTVKVTATVKTTGKKANKTLKWTSSNTKYATVSAKGVVKAKKAGKNKTVKITAQATDGSNKKYTVKIKIK